MKYISLIVNEDAAHDCLADLGKMGVIQFTDVSCAMFCLPQLQLPVAS
jgi:vacuolar-type H+-ATPase subunit I/STV1